MGGGRREGDRISCEPAAHPRLGAGPFPEGSLLSPSQQPCKLGSVTCILRLGNQCSKELLPASPGLGSQAQLFPEVRRHDGCSVFCQCLLLGFSPHLANGLVRMCVGDFGPRELVRIWWWRCVIRSLPYVQENHEALLFLRFSWVQ